MDLWLFPPTQGSHSRLRLFSCPVRVFLGPSRWGHTLSLPSGQAGSRGPKRAKRLGPTLSGERAHSGSILPILGGLWIQDQSHCGKRGLWEEEKWGAQCKFWGAVEAKCWLLCLHTLIEGKASTILSLYVCNCRAFQTPTTTLSQPGQSPGGPLWKACTCVLCTHWAGEGRAGLPLLLLFAPLPLSPPCWSFNSLALRWGWSFCGCLGIWKGQRVAAIVCHWCLWGAGSPTGHLASPTCLALPASW